MAEDKHGEDSDFNWSDIKSSDEAGDDVKIDFSDDEETEFPGTPNTGGLLPEIWSKIFGYLDFEMLQFTAILVCKDWYKMIRSDCTLSGQLVICPWPERGQYIFDYEVPGIGTDYLKDVALAKPTDINPVLKQWKALQTLELRHFNIKAMKKLDFKPCKNLAKVYINGFFPTGT